MSDKKNGHDIDFFRGNIKDDNNIDSVNEDTYSDFKFTKKPKQPIPNPIDYNKLERNKYNHLDQDEIILKRPLTDKAIEDIHKKSSNDPDIISGRRKPLKPKSEVFDDEPIKTYNNGKPNKKAKKNNNKRKFNVKKIILSILIVLLLAIIALVIFLFYIKATAPAVNVVVIGVDQRKDQSNSEIRADAIMSVNASIKDNKILVASIPRDTYSYIPCEEQYDKLAHAYAFGAMNWDEKTGGTACTTQTVSQMFNIGTEKYVKVNFSNMVGIIDAIGGVDLKSTATFCEQNSKDQRKNGKELCFKEGKKYHMDGEQALAYSRHRKSDDDIQRGLRQQQVFKAMFKQVGNANIWKWPGIYTKVSLMIDTNLTQKEMLQIALIYAGDGKMQNFKFGWGGFYQNGIAYVQLDENDVNTFTKKVDKLK